MKGVEHPVGIAGAPKVYTIREVSLITKSSVSTVYNQIRARRLVVKKIGGKTVVLEQDLLAWLKHLPTKAARSSSHSVRIQKSWHARRAAETQAT